MRDDATPSPGDARPRRVILGDGPILIEGPVEIVLSDGEIVRSDRFLVALCTCRRSGRYPFCDTSHRRSRPRRGSRSGEG
ncbi:CDGSH iron-sulfur domain-containing protein [Nonomuraea sp. NPDC050536]|uniref:CDGSH iron-sulfur domain-containing protein n=1 Tax=Nonomuraea sp. NPDC050536 TaxID=3364366 RepID=UPI0037CB1352